MTQFRMYAPKAAVGRKKLFRERITLPLPEGMTGEIDALLDEGEARLDLIRAAIETELKRRKRLAMKKSKNRDTD